MVRNLRTMKKETIIQVFPFTSNNAVKEDILYILLYNILIIFY
jgi:hypothetical protein